MPGAYNCNNLFFPCYLFNEPLVRISTVSPIIAFESRQDINQHSHWWCIYFVGKENRSHSMSSRRQLINFLKRVVVVYTTEFSHRTKSDYFLLQLDLFVFITEMEHVYCVVRTETSTIICMKFLSWNLAMAQASSFRSQTAEVRFQSQINSCEICEGRSGNGSGPSLSTWVFLFSVIPPIPQTYLHLDSFVRLTKGESSEYSKDQYNLRQSGNIG